MAISRATMDPSKAYVSSCPWVTKEPPSARPRLVACLHLSPLLSDRDSHPRRCAQITSCEAQIQDLKDVMDFCAESIQHDELTIKLMKTEISWLWPCGTTCKSSTVSQAWGQTGLGLHPSSAYLQEGSCSPSLSFFIHKVQIITPPTQPCHLCTKGNVRKVLRLGWDAGLMPNKWPWLWLLMSRTKASVLTGIRPQSPRVSSYMRDFGQVTQHPLVPCYGMEIGVLTSQSSLTKDKWPKSLARSTMPRL